MYNNIDEIYEINLKKKKGEREIERETIYIII